MALSTLAGFRPGVVFFYLSKRFLFLSILKWERPDKADSRKKSPKRCSELLQIVHTVQKRALVGNDEI